MQTIATPSREGYWKPAVATLIVIAFWMAVAGLTADRDPNPILVNRVNEEVVQEPAVLPVPVVEAPPDTLANFLHPGPSQAAEAIVPRVGLYDAPDGNVLQTLNNPTIERVPLMMSVLERSGQWLKVQVPVRPNETTGWIKESNVELSTVENHIVVEVSNRRLSAFSGSELLMQVPVGVGKARTPTPTGRFYVDIAVKNPGGAYGAFMLSVAGFSNVLRSFGNGVGQVAIHGTNNPGSVGQFSSNGCMRLNNAAVIELAGIAPPGTPVFVLP